ncbi:MAG: hypothetical protein JSV04_05875, partial [Candidatus Heimdallarchaeota archaeon]
AQEQMVYYNGGRTELINFNPQSSDWLPSTWRDGLHSPYFNPSESGGINAPAFKENGECIMFWIDFLKYLYGNVPDFNAEEALKILNLNRIKNFYFFSPNIPDEWERDFGPVTLQYIPYEDIDYYAIREFEDESVRYLTGYNGKEIYGAGETFWLYLLFEALGESIDKNALIVNLNVFDRDYPTPSDKRGYIVFNPYSEQKTLSFTLKHLSEPYDLYANGSLIGKFQPGESFNITLAAKGSAYLTINTPNLVSFTYIPRTDTTTRTTITSTASTTMSKTNSSITPSTPSVPVIVFILGSAVGLSVLLIFALLPRKK